MSEDAGEEYAAVYRDSWRRARKSHECDACDLTIEPGHQYHITFTVFEGAPDMTKRCARCQAIYEHLTSRMDTREEVCNPKLNCGHEYRERWEEDPPENIAALAFWLPKDGKP